MHTIGAARRIKAFAILMAMLSPFVVAFATTTTAEAAVTYKAVDYASTSANQVTETWTSTDYAQLDTIVTGLTGRLGSVLFNVDATNQILTVYVWEDAGSGYSLLFSSSTPTMMASYLTPVPFNLSSNNFTFNPGYTYKFTLSIHGGSAAKWYGYDATTTTTGIPELQRTQCVIGGVLPVCPHIQANFMEIDTTVVTTSAYFDSSARSARGVSAKCGITDIGGCITNAFAWAFLPSDDDWNAFHAVTFASTSPYGYLADMSTIFSGFASSSATSSIGVNLSTFSPLLPTSTIPIFSVNMIQHTIGPNWWAFVQGALGGIEWLIFLFWVYELAIWLV